MDAALPRPWSVRKKLLASALVAFHLAAVFIAPMWFASGQDSPAVAPLMPVFRPYINAMFLNHGYAFFAPEPGPSHLVEYKLAFDDGRAGQGGRFPDLQEQWPRLLYHRHFMLSESLYTYSNLPPLPTGAPANVVAENAARAKQRDLLRASFVKHLQASRGAASAEVWRIEHRPVFVDELLSGKRLNDGETYRNLDVADLPAPGGAP